MNSMFQTPAMQNLMQQMSSNPGMFQNMMQSPYMQDMMQRMVQNPELMASVSHSVIYFIWRGQLKLASLVWMWVFLTCWMVSYVVDSILLLETSGVITHYDDTPCDFVLYFIIQIAKNTGIYRFNDSITYFIVSVNSYYCFVSNFTMNNPKLISITKYGTLYNSRWY